MKLGNDRNDFSFYVLKNMFIFVSVFPFVLFASLEIIYHTVLYRTLRAILRCQMRLYRTCVRAITGCAHIILCTV